MGLPWWHGGWESACQCRGHRFTGWSRKIPLSVGPLSLCVTSYWACTCSAMRSHSRNQRKPITVTKTSLQPEKACAQPWRPHRNQRKPITVKKTSLQPEEAHHSHEDLTTTRERLCTATKTSPQPEKARAQPRRPSAAKTTKLIFKNLGEQKSIDGES